MSFILGVEKNTQNNITLTTERRFQNTAVYGATGSGKTRHMLLSMALQQFEDMDSGATFICGRDGSSWLLGRLAERMNREVIFLHPSSDRGTYDFLETEYRTGFEMQKNLIDYEAAIEEKKIIIIDFDLASNRSKGKKGLIKLLYHLQRSIIRNTEEHPHFIYIDDAEPTLPYIEELIAYGKDNSVGTTLFLDSYNLIEAKSRELAYFLNAYISTTITMNRLSYEDFMYFERRFFGNIDHNSFMRRSKEEVVVETIVNDIVEVLKVNIRIPSQRFVTELEEEVLTEKTKRRARKKPRSRGLLSEEIQPTENVEKDFNPPTRTNKVFLDEEEFFQKL